MRTYSNFLLFEDILSNLPEGSSLITSAAESIINPSVRVVEEDCGTLLGSVVDLDFEKEGLIEVATGMPLSRTRIYQLLESGIYKVAIRSLHSCNSKEGVCRKCLQGQYLDKVPAPVGSQIKIHSLLNYQSDLVMGNGHSPFFTLTESDLDYDKANVIKDGAVITSGFSIIGNRIYFDSVPTNLDVYVVRFYKETSDPLLGYIAKTYSGDLLGLKPLPTLSTLLKESMYQDIIPESLINMLQIELSPYKTIPSTFMEYIDKIHDKLEKALFIMYVYAIFSNVQV